MHEVTIQIGELPVKLLTGDAGFCRMLRKHYAGFLGRSRKALCELRIEILPTPPAAGEDNLTVAYEGGSWTMAGGDFHAEWNAVTGRGFVRQPLNPHSTDSVLRVLHSLLLARRGGLLIHAVSALRDGRAVLFAGVSGRGRTTVSSLAPHGIELLTDEISYVRLCENGYVAFGTPFSGEPQESGENLRAPLAAIYFFQKGMVNKIERLGPSEAAGALLPNVLFFAHEPEVVTPVFESACDLVLRVPTYRLTFYPDSSAQG